MWSYVRAWRRGELDLEKFVDLAREMGVRGVELLDVFFNKEDSGFTQTEAIARYAQSREIHVPIFSVSNDFTEEGGESFQRNLEIVRRGVDQAVLLGAEVVRVFAGGGENVRDPSPVYARVVEGLSLASEYAHSRGVRLALENHGRFAGRGAQVREIIHAVRAKTGEATLGSNPDPANFLLADENPVTGVSAVADLAYMAHLKDFATAGSERSHVFVSLGGHRYVGVPLGEGEVPLRECLRVLRDAGFQGWVSVEYEAEEEERTGVPKSVAVARDLLNQLNQD